MHQFKKHLTFLLCIFLFTILPSTMVFGEIRSSDDLKVRFDVFQVENTKEVKGTITITNIGIRGIKDISLRTILPDSITLKEEYDLTHSIETMGPGQSETLEFMGELAKVDPPLVEEPNETPEANPGGNTSGVEPIKPEDQSQIPGGDIIDPPLGNQNSVKTGEGNTIFYLLFIMGASASLILVLSQKNRKKKISSLLIFALLFMLVGNTKKVNADPLSLKDFRVTELLMIGEEEYTFDLDIIYNDTQEIIITDGSTITRGEWISKIIEVMDLEYQQEIDIDQEIEEENRFNDIKDHEFEEDIFQATVLSIIDFDEVSFRPDEATTREFAAVTAVKALGFQGNTELICEDVAEIKNLVDTEVAVSLKLLPLEDHKFHPNRFMTNSEGQYLLEGIRAILISLEVDENYDSVIEFQDEVKHLSQDVLYERDGERFIFESHEEVRGLRLNDIFTLPDMTPYKIKEITIIDDRVVIQTITPEMEETLSYIDAQGLAYVDMDNFIPEEGVEVLPETNAKVFRHVDEEGSIQFPGSIDLSINFTGDKKIIRGGREIEIEADASVSFPEISWKADVDLNLLKSKINNAFLTITKEVSTSIKCSSNQEKVMELKDGFVQLGKVPVVGIPGIAVYAVIGLTISLEGEIKIGITVEGDSGVQVLKNIPRGIRDVRTSFDGVELSGSYKSGVKAAGILEILGIWDLLDFSVFAGPVFMGNATVRDPKLICLEIKSHLAMDMSLLEDCVIDKWLNVGYTWAIFDENNSPLKAKLHFENLRVIPQCTYQRSTVNGLIIKAGQRSESIANAKIVVRNPRNNKVITETTSDQNGQYTLKLQKGDYQFIIMKPGYINLISTESLEENEVKYLQSYMMVSRGEDGEEGLATGIIKDALTGQLVHDIKMTLRPGWNNTLGEGIKTIETTEGEYSAILPLGNYTMEMEKEGYYPKSFNIYVRSGESGNQNSSMVPLDAQFDSKLRIVMTWGEEPQDLDSHLYGPMADQNQNFHVSYRNRTHYEGDELYVDLDLDDVSSYGPETITIHKTNDTGIYRYYVHNYSYGLDSENTSMSTSGAQVEIYQEDGTYHQFSIPVNQIGVYWHVFDYDAKTKRVIPVNGFSNTIENQGMSIMELEYFTDELKEEKKE